MKRNYLLGLAVVGSLFSAGCDNSQRPPAYIEGVVIKEGGTILERQQLIEKSSGALFGNESVKFGKPTYVIQIESNDHKIYSLGIACSSESFGFFETKLETLALAIEPGTKLKIRNYSAGPGGPLRNVDTITDSYVEILGKSEPNK